MDDLEDLIEKYTDVGWNRAKLMMHTMGTEELLELMADLGLYANRSVALEIAKRSDALFWLRKKLQDGSYWYKGEGWAPIHAIYILPLVGGAGALELALEMLRYRNEDIGDCLTESIPAILYAFGGDGIDAMKDFIKDETLEPFARSMVVLTLTVFARKGVRYDELKDYLVELMESTEDKTFATLVADSLAELGDPEVWPAIHRAFQEGRTEEGFISEEEIKDTIDGAYEDVRERELERCTRDPLDFFSRREVKEWSIPMREEARKEREAGKKKKIGRNDPCPCGSGKKFKKCCMGKGIYD